MTNEIITTRLISAPRHVVFHAWIDPTILTQWWGPKGFTNTFHEFDPRPGGNWLFTMHGPDGSDYDNRSVFVTIAEPELIVFDHHEPMHRFRTIVTFEDHGGKTTITWRMLFGSAEEYEKVKAFIPAANEENLDKLEEVLLRP